MKLTRDEWIIVGAGNLFNAPFLSRVLLYRLRDINYSILIYHDRTHIVSEAGNVDMAGKIQVLPGINIGHVVMATEVCESPIVSIHYCPTSCSIAFEDLVKLPVKRLSFEECVSDVNHFGEIDFCIEPSSIRYSKRMLAAYPNLKAQRFNVEDSNHIVTGPVGITNLPDSIPTDKVRRRCWKIRLQNSKSNIRYEIGERTHWGLAAMDVNEEGQSDAAVYLECKND